MKYVLQPAPDRLVVRPVAAEEMEKYEKPPETTSLLIKPDTVKEKPMVGEVIAAGFRSQYLPPQRVLYGKYSGNEVTLNGEQLLILKVDEIFASVAVDGALIDPAVYGD